MSGVQPVVDAYVQCKLLSKKTSLTKMDNTNYPEDVKEYIQQSTLELKRRMMLTMMAAKLKQKRKKRTRKRRDSIKDFFMLVLTLTPLVMLYYFCIKTSMTDRDSYALATYDFKTGSPLTYDADAVPDYALESAGAEIYGVPEAQKYTAWAIDLFSLRIPLGSGSEKYVLQPTLNPGECWAFAGSYGAIKIKLSHTIIPEAVTIDHIQPNVCPTGKIDSAPRHFTVFASEEGDGSNKEFMGSFEFQKDGPPTQTFLLQPLRHIGYPARIIQFQFHSNHGHPKYTCVYKLRVHGQFFKL